MRKLIIGSLLLFAVVNLQAQGLLLGKRTAKSGGVEYPSEITTNAVVFYDIQKTSTITKDGSNLVSAWDDALGSALSLVQATGTMQPTWYADSIVFDGLAAPDGDNLKDATAVSQPITLYLVMKQTTWTSGDVLWGGTNCYMSQRTASPQIRINAGLSLANAPDFPVNQFKVVTIVLNGASSAMYVNNVLSTSGDASTGSIATFAIGASTAGGSMSNVAYQAILIHSAADDATIRTAVYDWMIAKYTF